MKHPKPITASGAVTPEIKIKFDSAIPKHLFCLESDKEWLFLNTETNNSFVIKKPNEDLWLKPSWLNDQATASLKLKSK